MIKSFSIRSISPVVALYIIFSFIVIIILLSYFFVPVYMPGIGMKYSPILSIYLRSTNSMSGNNVSELFDSHIQLRNEWLNTTKSRFGSIEEDLYSLSMSDDHSEKR